ncbi:hypothetical protein H8356DRAFT_1279823 [Neocallimastix lanati (nom. inval.)]|uniref:Coth-domain-containing protein n=1 Tax=Neocallimastix californiae TaxID=1754190 RepID=A0A1Y2BTQ8_9FUNG|nr:hypothetical protein H8356DRAFT_1279823 [Neocallimastix sp. JGI-2020a]ORY38017.1 hypothetical protein LY90DRAFT_511017 [Neocallimastix californiae]|eukprot:ORY38017.1 hypothetical protein LY90DRAFT_511017 [Neocallimastix californiae]
MNCILISTLLLLAIVGQVFGRIVNFSIIAFGKDASVTFNGKTLNMLPVDNYSGVKSVSAFCPDEEFEYTYTLDGKTEGFTRKLEKGELTTHNELFGRKETISPLKGMGYPEDKPQWKRSIGKTELFDDSYIPTVIIDNASRSDIVEAPDMFTMKRFTIILMDEIFTEENVVTKTQNRYQDKFQFRVKLENKIHKRKIFKFRASADDPTFLRQPLYGDMAAAIGNPVHNQVIVRVYMSDGTPVGLYLMIEVTSSKSFIKSQFYGNEETGKITIPATGLGYPLDCATGADFKEGNSLSSFKADEGENNKKIKYLIEAMHELDVNDENEVKEFSKKWLDLDTFFKALVLEYLTGHWDSYWMYTSNFVMYDAPEESTKDTFKYYFIDQDFDQTFGIGLSHKINTYGDEFPSQSYKTLVDRSWNIADSGSDGSSRAAIDIFLKGGVTTKMFEQHLIDIVKHVFNPVALGRRIEEYTRRYTEEIEWDYNMKRIHPAYTINNTHTIYYWTMSDFYSNMDSSRAKSVAWGLKQWIKMRAEAVSEEFDFEWDDVPLDPIEKVVNRTEIVVDDDDDDEGTKLKNGSISIKVLSNSTVLTVLVSLVLVFYI